MSVLAVLLVGIGLADLTRSLQAGTTGWLRRFAARRVLVLPSLVGVVAVVGVAALAGLLAEVASACLVGLAAVSTVLWLLLSERAVHSRRQGHLVALVALAGALLLQVLLSGWALPAGGWLADWLAWARLPWTPSAERALLVVGLVLLQLSTGNVIVRLVLTSIGALRPDPPAHVIQPSDELKGGRLLGPLERVFILGLGLAGQVTAAGLVIAAKGLIRWPELKAKSEGDPRSSGIDAVTEYFLVGSFVSWLVALVALFAAQG